METNKVKAILIGAGQRGAQVYGAFARRNPNDIVFVAVAEPDEARRKEFCRDHGICPDNAVEDWHELLARPKMADCAFVCTQDNQHIAPAMAALQAGYHVVMEKPMSRHADELRALKALAEEKGKLVTVCHVLRYTPFFSKVKELLDAGEIGQLQSVQQIENVAYWHQAHSFVRGNWRREDETSPMILAKSCHDIQEQRPKARLDMHSIEAALSDDASFPDGKIEPGFLDRYTNRIVKSNNRYIWMLQLMNVQQIMPIQSERQPIAMVTYKSGVPYDIEQEQIGKQDKESAGPDCATICRPQDFFLNMGRTKRKRKLVEWLESCQENQVSVLDEKIPLLSFAVDFVTAYEYQKARGIKIHPGLWKDMRVDIFLVKK